MAPEGSGWLIVGHVRKPHGNRGELVVESLTDHPGDVFAPGVVLRPGDADGSGPDADLPPLRIAGSRPFQRGVLVTFGGVEDRDAADLLRGRYLLMERDRLPPPEEDEVFYHELLGLAVVTVDGEAVGTVTEVFESRPADLLEVRTGRGTLLIPFLAALVREVDVPGGRLVIDPPDGLLDL